MIGMIQEKSPYQFIHFQNHYSVNFISGTNFGPVCFVYCSYLIKIY